MSANDRICIIGAGHAGGTAAALLRQQGFTGAVTLVGDEPIPPYQRPPLSKAWLKGEVDAETLALKPLQYYADQAIDFLPGVQARCIDRARRRVRLSTGPDIAYDYLILATGARPVALSLPGVELDGIQFFRSAADAEQLKSRLNEGKRLAVIGGGYIGLEVAASGRSLGADVIVLERESRLLARVACEKLSTFFLDYHSRKGVVFELNCLVTGFLGEAGRVTGVMLADGRVIACDTVVVGVGACPNEEIAAAAGLETARGIIVDLEARTSDPAIFAIGDVTQRPMPLYNRMFRMESVPNALEQAKQAVAAILGRPAPPREVPWQWSDQYDLKLQIAGYAFDADTLVTRGNPEDAKFAVFHLQGDLLQSVEAINSPADFMVGKKLIGSRTSVDHAKLADLETSLRDVAIEYHE